MGKIYKFPLRRQNLGYEQINPRQNETNRILGQLMDTLITTYKDRVQVLEGYKKEIMRLNGLSLKGPKDLLKEVKALQKLFGSYGISCNFFKFYSREHLEVIYYNESDLLCVYKDDLKDEGLTYTTGEFIQNFAGYSFTLNLDEALLNLFDKQINNLNITIETLNNTQV